MTEIEAKIKAIIVDKLGVDGEEVKPEASFTNDLGADSLDTVELIMEIEKAFAISIPDDQAEKIETVADAVEYVEIASIGTKSYNSSSPGKPKESCISQPDIQKINKNSITQ